MTVSQPRDRNKQKKISELKGKDLEAEIPVTIKESDRKYQFKIPVKIEEKKEKPKHRVKFYKGTKGENRTVTEKPEKDPAEERVPIVKGSFSDVKPDFLVPIPKETIPRDINSISPLNDFRNYFRLVAGRLRAGKPDFIEGLQPPPPPSFSAGRPFLQNIDPYDRRNCSFSYSGNCHPSMDGYPYPDVGGGTESPFPRPTYGVPNTANDWQRPNDHENDWNTQRPGTWGQGSHNGNDWGGGGGGGGGWSQNQGNRRPWNAMNPERPVYGPPDHGNDDRRPWNSASQGEWNGYQGRPGTTPPVRLNARRGMWISCKPFEIFSGREAREEPFRCPQHNVPSATDFSAATPASKIDDKTLFQDQNNNASVEDRPKARLIFPS